MAILKIKGNEINVSFTTGSASRYAALFRANIINFLRELCIPANNIRIEEEPNAIKRAGAEVYWYMEGHNCYYSYSRQARYVDNLHVILKLIEVEVNKLLNGEKSIEEFLLDFREDDDLIDKRKAARELLGLQKHENDLTTIDRQFKKLAREAHPDVVGGDTEKFKSINEAHKILRKELE